MIVGRVVLITAGVVQTQAGAGALLLLAVLLELRGGVVEGGDVLVELGQRGLGLPAHQLRVRVRAGGDLILVTAADLGTVTLSTTVGSACLLLHYYTCGAAQKKSVNH